MKNRNFYFAGKPRKNCWRHKLVRYLGRYDQSPGILAQNDFNYLGPFYCKPDLNRCDGNFVWEYLENNELRWSLTWDEVIEQRISSIKNADCIFCYIDEDDCFDALIELGVAISRGIPVFLVFAPSVASDTQNKYKMACFSAEKVYFDKLEKDLPAILNEILRRFK